MGDKNVYDWDNIVSQYKKSYEKDFDIDKISSKSSLNLQKKFLIKLYTGAC